MKERKPARAFANGAAYTWEADTPRVGQIWRETFEDRSEDFLILGLESFAPNGTPCSYRMLCLDTGELDWVASHRIDQPDELWERVL